MNVIEEIVSADDYVIFFFFLGGIVFKLICLQ